MIQPDRLMLPMRDGVRLATYVFRPVAGRHHVLLCRTPYGVEVQGQVAAEELLQTYVHPGGTHGLLDEGWAVVLQDARGRFASEGRDLAFVSDIDDGDDTVRWCTRQPWCTGRVVMSLPSALGAIQFMAALSGASGLAAISPIVGALDPRTGWVLEGGAFQLGFILPWAAGQVHGTATDAHAKRIMQAVTDDLGTAYREPLSRTPVRRWSPFFDAWIRDDPAYWAPLQQRLGRSAGDIAGLHIAGWYDIFAESSLAGYRWMAETGRGPQRLIVGPWGHSSLGMRVVGELDFGEQAERPALRDELRGFLRAAADCEPCQSRASIFVMGRNRWQEMPQWPPAAQPFDLYLAPAARLDVAPVPDHGGATFRYDPHDPTPTCGGRALSLPEGPRDQRDIEARDDVLVFTGAVLDRDVTIMGMVSACVCFATTGRSADVAVKLVDVHPDGRAFNVVDSVRRAAFEPGRLQEVAVDLGSSAMTFRAGHRIRVQVSSCNFPRLDRNPSTGEAPAEAQELCPATQTVCWGGAHASRITLPIVERAAPG